MNRRRITVTILIAAALLGVVLGVAKWRESRSFFEPARLLSRFPVEDSTVVSIDFASLRTGGFLTPQKTPVEADYKSFVDSTGFDYRRDLDSAVATLGPSGNYFVARGRFQWDKLRAYAAQQGGSCYEQLCRMPGSTPERRISFLPLRDDAIAIGVSTNDLAATKLTHPGKVLDTTLPQAPAWVSIPGSALRRPNSLPPGLRLLLSALTTADRVVVKVAPAGTGVEARLETQCHSVADARVLSSQLKTATSMLQEAVSRDHQTAQDELAVFLVSGKFDQNDKQVTGRWPVKRSLLDSLTSGI